MSEQKNLILFLDSVQRTIIGEVIGEDSNQNTITIRNPVVTNIVQGQQQGQLALQLLPVFFMEFKGDIAAPVDFDYHRDQITETEFEGGFDFKLYAQYDQLFTVQPAAPAPEGDNGQTVLKLFDDAEVEG